MAKPGRYHAFIDESEVKDEKLLVLGAVLIHQDDLPHVERELNRVREVIGRKMRRERYDVYNAPLESLKGTTKKEAVRLRAGGLPEIHAKDMWQLVNVYRRPFTRESRKLRDEWVSRVTRIFSKYPLIYVNCNFQGRYRLFENTSVETIVDALSGQITPDQSTKKIRELLEDVHFAICFELFMYLDDLAQEGIEIVSVTCDKGKRTEVFGKFEGFERARAYGYWQNFPDPVFLDSDESNGIQLADFYTYFFAKTFYTVDCHDPAKVVFEQLRHCHRHFRRTSEAKVHSATVPPPRARALMAAMQIEAVLLHCGGQSKSLPQRQASAEQAAHHLLSTASGITYRSARMDEAGIASYTGPVWLKASTSLGDDAIFPNNFDNLTEAEE